MFTSLFKPSPVHAAGLRLLACVTAAARQESLFAPGLTPNTLAGRFEMMAAFGALLVLRLRPSPDAQAVLQAFIDGFFKQLDAGLREAGVGDLTVPKKMKAIAGAFYGRLGAYEAALGSKPEQDEAGRLAAVAAVAGRNVWPEAQAPAGAPILAAYLVQVYDRLAAMPLQQVEDVAAWPRFATPSQV
jgi:cytochrome b pre-mRNA-processing protein 3